MRTKLHLLLSLGLAALLLGACGTGSDNDFADPDRYQQPAAPTGSTHPVRLHHPPGLGVVDTELRDINGQTIGIVCATCHGPNPDESIAARVGEPEEFHSTVDLTHGDLNCNSCHDADNRGLLHLADGTPVELEDAKTLCAQCHGVQVRDFDRGSHGGMTGYWDLSQGPRIRNHCLDCHEAHKPTYKQVLPVFPPRDRYLHRNTEEVHP